MNHGSLRNRPHLTHLSFFRQVGTTHNSDIPVSPVIGDGTERQNTLPALFCPPPAHTSHAWDTQNTLAEQEIPYFSLDAKGRQ